MYHFMDILTFHTYFMDKNTSSVVQLHGSSNVCATTCGRAISYSDCSGFQHPDNNFNPVVFLCITNIVIL